MDKEYLKQVKGYIEYTGCLNNTFGCFCKLYSMTTENIYGFLQNYDLKDKKILTVAGSGDQRLNAYLMGAKDVTCFDINPLTLLQLKLKDTAINTINFEKFIKFFGIYSRKYSNYYHTLDSRIFNELQDLDEDTLSFFKFIIDESPYIDDKDIYFSFENDLNILQKMNNYLNPDSYIELRKILKTKDINFINSNLGELPEKLNGEKYDMILLSNISDYTNNIYLDNDLKRYRELIDKLTDNLNLYGTIQLGYIYSNYSKKDNVSNFHIKEERQKYFSTDLFHSLMVESYDGNNKKDKVIVYQKK